MSGEWVRWAVELVAAVILVCTGWSLVRHYTTRLGEDGKPKGIGGRAVQNLIAFSTLPAILIFGWNMSLTGQ